MTGNVVVDDIQTEEEQPGRRAPVWLLALGGVALVVLFMLPGQPEAVPPSPSLTIPDVIVPEDRWQRLDLPGSESLADVAMAGDGTYVAVGDGPQFWASMNLTDWTLMPSTDVDPASAAAVTAFGDGAVAVGSTRLGDLTTRAAAWVSTDLATWEMVSLIDDGESGLEGVLADGDRLIAWGWRGTDQPFSPAGEALLLASSDGFAWREIPPPTLDARIYAVRPRPAGGWWAMGYEIGRPALWSSDDLQEWEAVPTRGLPFGWAMVELVDPNRVSHPLLATLIDVGDGRIRRWQLEEDGEWTALGKGPGGPSHITTHQVERFGTDGFRLWMLGDDHTEREALDVWEPLDLDGEVHSVAGQVAVGEYQRRPVLWIADAGTPTFSLPEVAGPGWERAAELGEGAIVDAWRIGAGWVVGGWTDSAPDRRWWYLDREGAEPIDPGWSYLERIDPVGEEWVSVPSMLWSDDGREWEERAEVAQTPGYLLAALPEEDGDVVALHANRVWMWAVSRSSDGGRSWETLAEPVASTPIWDVAPSTFGFVGTAARQRGTQAVVFSTDGVDWNELEGVDRLLNTEVPAAVSEQGTLLLLDTGEETEVPRLDITHLSRAGDELALLAGGRLWIGHDDDWESIPLDAAHGLAAASLAPVVIDGRVHVVASDGTMVALYEWRE